MPHRIHALLEREVVRFVITGVGAAGLLALLTFLALLSPLPPFVGTLLAYGVTVLAAYKTQQAWTFRGRHGHGAAFPRYCAAQAICAGGTATLAQALTHAGLPPAPVSLIATVASSVASYLLSRFWVFPAQTA